jgi:hypothetical protein
MIIVQLTGGLGNQMFQYAIAKHLAEKHQTRLKIDISPFEKQSLRAYDLTVFNISDELISTSELYRYFPRPAHNIIQRIIHKIVKQFYGYAVLYEPHFHFSPEILKAQKKSYLIGYWQSEKYFKLSESLIRKSFQFKTEATGKNSQLLDHISKHNSVSVHIRRGDYIQDSYTLNTHGVCEADYYSASISLIAEKIKSPVFYLFSDDIDWVKRNMTIPVEHYYIDNNSENGWEDMRLMSQCKHNIIANSSFSWWGAWLNNNPEKMVIAPRKWFNDTTRNTHDLLPDSWIKL